MAQNRNFLETALKSLSEEEFGKAIEIFQTHYLKNQIVVVDGHNDGGCDIKIFKNRRETKHCVQVTVNKNIESKLKKDLKKVDALITTYKYSENFDFFCSIPISDDKVNEYVKYAKDTYDIALNIYEAKRLAQLDCPDLERYLYSLHDGIVLRPEEMSLDKSTQLIYDMLAEGRDSSDIKRGVLSSIIVTTLYQNGTMNQVALTKEVERRISKTVPSLSEVVSYLITENRIRHCGDGKNDLELTESELDNVKEAIATSKLNEAAFMSSLSEALRKADVFSEENLYKSLEAIKDLFRTAYRSDIDERIINASEDWDVFEDKITDFIPDQEHRTIFINSVKSICEDNSYINRIIASESFFSLYKSNSLERYLSQKDKAIFLDTPTIMYFLCAVYTDRVLIEWKNPFFKSVLGLVEYQEKNPNKLRFCVMRNYLHEVANEIRKALHLSWIEESPISDLLGNTTNVLYNYYRFLAENEGFELEDDIQSVEDFIYRLGVDNTDPDSDRFKRDTVNNLASILDDLGVTVCDEDNQDWVYEAITEYQTVLSYLSRDNKSTYAIQNDSAQLVYLLSNTNGYDDYYLATWDQSLEMLRDALLRSDTRNRYHYARISSPASISNRIALSSFNIDQSAITNDVFLYADKTYEISKKIKSLKDLIAPILTKKTCRHGHLLRLFADIRSKQLEVADTTWEQNRPQHSLVDEIFANMIPSGKELHEKFVQFINDEGNIELIIATIDEAYDSIQKTGHFSYESFHKAVAEYYPKNSNQ